MWVFTHPLFGKKLVPSPSEYGRECMYLLTVKDGLVTRHIGPYPSPKEASDDLERVLSSSSDRARWQIYALESPRKRSLVERIQERDKTFTAAVS